MTWDIGGIQVKGTLRTGKAEMREEAHEGNTDSNCGYRGRQM